MEWFGIGKRNGASDAALPYGARLRGAVQFEELMFKINADALGFQCPQNPQMIEAIGDIDLGSGNRLYRLYLTDDAFLQIATTNGAPGDVNLFVYADSINPSSQAEFQAWVSAGRPSEYRLGAYTYNRVWGENDVALAPSVPLEERVYKKDLHTPEYDLTVYSMLYSRALPDLDRNEMLLVAGEDSGPNDFVISQAVGIALTTAEFDIT